MKLYPTNRKDDPGVEVEPAAIAAAFWSSEDAVLALEGNLARPVMKFVMDTYGTWTEPAELDAIFDAVHDAMPRERRS